MAATLEDGATRGHAIVQPLCRNLQTRWPALWTFTAVDGVEPTNNAAEQALRPAVLWRKESFGTHSTADSRFVERMLTVWPPAVNSTDRCSTSWSARSPRTAPAHRRLRSSPLPYRLNAYAECRFPTAPLSVICPPSVQL